MSPKPFKFLRKLKLREVSLVPQGANPGAHVMIAKAEAEKEMHGMTANDLREKLTNDLHEVEGMEDDMHCYLADFDDAMVVYEMPDGLFQRAYTFAADGEVTFEEPTEVVRHTSYVAKDEEPVMPDPNEPTRTPEELQAEVERLQGELDGKADVEAELETARTDLEKALADLEAAKEGEPEPDDEVRKELDAAKQREEDLTAKVEKLEKERRAERFAKAAEGYAPLEQPKVASLLEAADEHFDEEQQKTLKALLKGAAEQVEKGALFDQFALADAHGGGSWQEQLEKEAHELVASGDADTLAQAKVTVMNRNPEIRKEYEASVRS